MSDDIPPSRIEPGTEAYWKDQLTPEQYRVCVEKGTERPFSGEYTDTAIPGTYHCICCDAPLFRSSAKFDSGCGWPSYFEPVSSDSVRYEDDNSLARFRIEVLCGSCNAHLGHVFDDGPPPTGKRYCINSVCLKLDADEA